MPEGTRRKVMGYGLRALVVGLALWLLWQWSLNGRYQAVHLADMFVAIVDSRTGNVHIPSDLVVDRWVSDGEGSSVLQFPFLHDVWANDPS
jgi:hypothetical protein